MSSYRAIKILFKTNVFLSTDCMPRLAVTTTKGELVAEHQVADEQVVVVLHKWLCLLTSSEVVVSVDGARLSEEDKKRILALRLIPAAATPAVVPELVPAPIPAPAELAAYASTIHHAFDQIREAEWRTTERAQAFTAKYADELARQRQMMHQCIRDVDSVDRAVVATNHADRFSARIHGAANSGPTGKPTIGLTDIIHGFREVMNKYGGNPE